MNYFHLFFLSKMLLSKSTTFHKLLTTNMSQCTSVLNNGSDLKRIFLKGVDAVNPKNLITGAIKYENGTLKICDKPYKIKNKCYVVGYGKAVKAMAEEVERVLGSNLARGIVSVPVGILGSGTGRQAPLQCTRVKYIEGALNNLPDAAAETAALEIKSLVENMQKDDLLIVLITGGGSALLPVPKSTITLEEKQKLVKLLGNSGADIMELNCVRKRLSELKGGGLARLAYPATVVSLILSDVIRDPLDFIASGSTTPNTDPPDAAANVIKSHGLYETLPNSIKQVLSSEMDDMIANVPFSKEQGYHHVTNNIIGNNKSASKECKTEAIKLGYQAVILSCAVKGEVSQISQKYCRIALGIARVMSGESSNDDLRACMKDLQADLSISDEVVDELMKVQFCNEKKAICLIFAGEPTVNVKGKGKGGRNLQLALQFSYDIHETFRNICKTVETSFLSCGTDGIDGPTDAAGAIGSTDLCQVAERNNIPIKPFLDNNDCYNFYEQFDNGSNMIKIGHTGTNVMDIHLVLVKKIKNKG